MDKVVSELCRTFVELDGLPKLSQPMAGLGEADKIFVDCANGDGTAGIETLTAKLKAVVPNLAMKIVLYNKKNAGGGVGDNCGSSFVTAQGDIVKQPPKIHNCGDDVKSQYGAKYISLGDNSDSMIYYYPDQMGTNRLLDGSRIATILAFYFNAGLEMLAGMGPEAEDKPTVGVVLLEGRNPVDRATRYLDGSMKIPVKVLKQGNMMSDLEAEAGKFDAGIFFCADTGCGGVKLTEKFRKTIGGLESAAAIVPDPMISSIPKKLGLFMKFFDTTTHRGLGNFVAVEWVLRDAGLNAQQWDMSLAAKCRKIEDIQVPDVSKFEAKKLVDEDDGTVTYKLTTPTGAQDALDAAIGQRFNASGYARPMKDKGNVVELCAEDCSQAETKTLFDELKRIIEDASKK